MAAPRDRIWSWQDPPGGWVEVGRGEQQDVDRRYATARRYGVAGAAFVLMPPGETPHKPPRELGVPVVEVAAPEPVKPEEITVLAVPFDLLTAATGHPIQVTDSTGRSVVLRIPTREEYRRQVARSRADLIAKGCTVPPMPTDHQIDQLIKPLPERRS